MHTAAVIEKENINNGSNWVFFKTAIAMDVEVGGVNPILEFLKLFWKNEKLKKCQVCFF